MDKHVFEYHTDVWKTYSSLSLNIILAIPVVLMVPDINSWGRDGDQGYQGLYGVWCNNGNQSERALRMIAEKYPTVYANDMNDLYVDDRHSVEACEEVQGLKRSSSTLLPSGSLL